MSLSGRSTPDRPPRQSKHIVSETLGPSWGVWGGWGLKHIGFFMDGGLSAFSLINSFLKLSMDSYKFLWIPMDSYVPIDFY